MWTNSQETADLFTFTKVIVNGQFHFIGSANDFPYHSELIKPSKQFVQCLHQFVGGALRGELGETFNVCKQDAEININHAHNLKHLNIIEENIQTHSFLKHSYPGSSKIFRTEIIGPNLFHTNSSLKGKKEKKAFPFFPSFSEAEINKQLNLHLPLQRE